MERMFQVRSPVPGPPTCSRALPCTLRAPRSRSASHPPARTSPRIACPPFDSRQDAWKFNRPLSFDTSSVRNMVRMFQVRSACSRAHACTPFAPPSLRRPPISRPAAHLAPHRIHPPVSDIRAHQLRLHAVSTSYSLSASYFLSFRHSAGRAGVPPAAELRHFQRHRHDQHAPGGTLNQQGMHSESREDVRSRKLPISRRNRDTGAGISQLEPVCHAETVSESGRARQWEDVVRSSGIIGIASRAKPHHRWQ